MATNTSPGRTCRQSVVQLVTRISGSRAPKRSRTGSSRSETPAVSVGRCFTRGLLACNVLGIIEKYELRRPRERDALPTERPDIPRRQEVRQGEFWRQQRGFIYAVQLDCCYMPGARAYTDASGAREWPPV